MKKIRYVEILYIAGILSVIMLTVPRQAHALTRWGGIFFIEDTYAANPEQSTNIFQSGIVLDIAPPVKKQLNARFNIQFNYTNADGETIWHLSPIGDLTVALSGEGYSFDAGHSRFATVTTEAELVETETSRAGLSFSLRDLRLVASYARAETSSPGTSIKTDTYSLFGDYKYKWVNFRGGYNAYGGGGSNSDTVFFGLGGSYEILPGTQLSADFDVNRYSSESSEGFKSTTTGRNLRLAANSRPVDWFGLAGNFIRSTIAFDSETAAAGSTLNQSWDTTANVYPLHNLQLSATTGNRRFSVDDEPLSVDFTTLGASFFEKLRETIALGVNISRTLESDPKQGRNIRDSFGLNSTMDLTSRLSMRFNLNISRNDSPGFINTAQYDASGPLTDRVLYDDRPTGFTFFDILNNDLYTKRSPAPGDWSDPVHIEPITSQFSVSRTLQLNMIPTDKSELILLYTANSSSDTFDIIRIGTQVFSGSLSYRPNLRTSYSVTGTVNLPENEDAGYSATASMAYRFLRGHQMNVSYGRQVSSGANTDSVVLNLRLQLWKRNSLEVTYSISQLFKEDQGSFARIRYSIPL
jgi:hypothetical protein